MVKAEVKVVNGGPTLLIDGKPVFPMESWIPAPPWDESGKSPHTEDEHYVNKYLQPLKDAGIKIYHFGVEIGDWFGRKPGRDAIVSDMRNARKIIGVTTTDVGNEYWCDFSKIDKQLQWLNNYDPEGVVHIRIGMEFHPTLYSWWRQVNPRELEVYSDGTVGNQSMASIKWLRDCSEILYSLVTHLRSTSYGQNVIALQPCVGGAGEWVKDWAMENYAADYSEVMRVAFADWLRKKYGDINTLRKAWHEPYLHWWNIEIPGPEEQVAADLYQFRDPEMNRKVIDYFEFFSDLSVNDIIHFCKVIKDASRNEVLAGVFYGYLLGLSWCNWFFDQDKNSKTTAYQRSGHLALNKVLSSPYVDFIASPIDYGFRGMGGDSSPMPLLESIRLHGKIYFFEDDTRTHLFAPGSMYGMARNLKETLAILTRNFGKVITSSSGCWYANWPTPFDRPGPYQDPAIVERLRRFREIGTKSVSLDRSPIGEIAVLVDEKSFLYERMSKNFDFPQVFMQKLFGLARIGAPFDTYLLSDIGKLSDQYKCYIFLNTVHISGSEREIVKRVVRRNGKVAVWLYCSGMTDDREISAENMEDITGIRFVLDMHEWPIRLIITNFEHPITKNLPANMNFGTDLDLGPIPYVDDPNATELGTLVYSRGMCVPGMAVKEFDGWKSVYIGAPNVPSDLLRAIAQYAGVHIFSHSDDVLYASKNFITLHTMKSGLKKIYLPRESTVYDVLENRRIIERGNDFVDEVRAGETKVYYYGDEPI
jgi:hypothetical protein